MSDGTDRGRLFVVCGIPGSGTTSVGLELAQTLGHAVFVDGAVIGDMVVSGRHEMTDDPTPEAVEQLLFRYAGALVVADTYRAAGFDAVVADTVSGEYLDDLLEIAKPETVHLVVLHPSPQTVTSRDQARGTVRGTDTYRAWEVMEGQTARLGLWLDTSEMNVPDTVLQIIQRQQEAEVVPFGA